MDNCITHGQIDCESWKDITLEFSECCKVLKLGEVLNQPGFSLFEGMSAIELMDAKMDAGMQCNQRPIRASTFAKAVQMEILPVENFTNEQIISIFDDTFSNLIAWLEGHSLAQTLFTNMYLHEPSLIVNSTVSAFSVLILKLTDILKNIILMANVYEEEDFQLVVYGFKLCTDVPENQAMSAVKSTEEVFNKIVKSTRTVDKDAPNASTEIEHLEATKIAARLKFSRLFFSLINSLYKDKSFPTESAKILHQLKDVIALILSTANISSSDRERELAVGFEPMINQHLLPPTFPRSITILDRHNTWVYLDEFIDRLLLILPVTTIGHFHDLFTFMLEFSYSNSCLLSRSILQLIVISSPSKIFNKDLMSNYLKESIKVFSAPPVLMHRCPLYKDDELRELVDSFLVTACHCAIIMLQICGHNNARQRDKWVAMLDDLTILQVESEKLDTRLNELLPKSDVQRHMSIYFGTWTMYLTLRVMLCYILSGLQLELYSHHEYVYIYWYLCEGLFSWISSTINRASEYQMESENLYGDNQRGSKAGKKSKPKKKPKPINNELLYMQALQNLAGGYYKAVIGLQLEKKIKLPKFDFDCEEVRYNHRFLPFANLNAAPHLSYLQFKKMTDVSLYNPPISSTDLFSGSSKCFLQAKQLLKELSNTSIKTDSLLMVAKTNYVVMNVILGGHKKNSNTPIDFDFKIHKFYPVMKFM